MPVMKVYNSTTSQWEDVGAGGLTNPMTTAGDMIYGGTDGAPTRLAKGTDGQVLTLASGLPSWGAASGSASLLVAETVVSGSAVTSVTFSDLDGNADGGYVLVVTAKNATANASGLCLTLNNDTTAANYNYRTIFKSNTGTAAASADGVDNAILTYAAGFLDGNSDTAAIVEIIPSIDSTHIFTRDSYRAGAVEFIHQKYKSSANIISVEVVASIASSIAVGSTFRLYKRK